MLKKLLGGLFLLLYLCNEMEEEETKMLPGMANTKSLLHLGLLSLDQLLHLDLQEHGVTTAE